MASIQPGKLKLSNYKYELNDQGELVEKTGGAQPYSAKVIDSIDFDWRPFSIDFSSPDEIPVSFGDNRITTVSGQADMYSYSLYYTEDLIWLLNRGLTHSVSQSEEAEHSDYSGLSYYANHAYYSSLGYYANHAYYSGLAYYANHAYYSSLAYYANAAYTLSEIKYKNSDLTNAQKYAVSYVDKSTTVNGTSYVTICYTDLSSNENTGSEKSAVTLTNTTKHKLVDGVAQDSQGRITYSYLEVNTTHTNTRQGTVQNYVVNNVNIDANGNFTYTTSDLTVTAGIAGIAKTLTNSTTHNLVDGITQDGKGQITYHYIEINTTHTNNESGDVQDHSINNVHLDADGNFTYKTVNLSVSKGVKNSNPGKSTTGGKTIPGTLATAYNVVTGITEDAKGQISYTYTPIYLIPSHLNYHQIGLLDKSTDVPNIDNPSGNTVSVINGIDVSDKGENTQNHTFTYATVSLPTKEYVDALIKTNDAMRYCGTFRLGATDDTMILQPTDAHNGNFDTTRGAVYKYSDSNNSPAVISGIKIENGDTIYSYTDGDGASTTTLVGWNVIQQNINIANQSPLSSSSNSQQNNRIITNVHITNGGDFSYNYTDGLLNGNYTFAADTYTYGTAYVTQNRHTYFNDAVTYTDRWTIIKNVVDIYGNTTIDGKLSVTGATTLADLNADYTQIDELLVNGNTTLGVASGSFIPTTTIAGTAYNYRSYINEIAHYSNVPSYINNTLDIANNVSIGGDLTVSGNGKNTVRLGDDVSDETKIFGTAYLWYGSNATTRSYINNTATYIVTPTYVKNSLTVKEATVLGTNLDVKGNEVVRGDSYTYHTAYNGSSYINATADYINPKTYINNTLTVKGATELGSTLNVKNATTVDGSTDLKSNLIVRGDTYTYANTYIGDAATDVLYMRAKVINLNENNTYVEFEGLDKLWGTLS